MSSRHYNFPRLAIKEPNLTNPGKYSGRSPYTDNATFWIKIIREHLDRYRSELTDQAVLDAIGPFNGLTILDAGCGEGYLSRILSHKGAQVIGVDSCPELLHSAQELAAASHLQINYHIATVDNLPIEDNKCDIIVCNHLLNDLDDISAPFQEFARVIRQGGRLVILMLHPCFYGEQAEQSIMHRCITPNEYFQTRIIEQQFNVADIRSPAKVKMWFRPLEDYISQLCRSGFCVTSLLEPHPSTSQLSNDLWWRSNFVRPLFILIIATRTPHESRSAPAINP
jgi:2-polyprenyl-3-methyl-5-hydroxy-6-metoxy-1,4-benzoquinol methylase